MSKSNITDLSLDDLCGGQFRRQVLAALEEALINCEDPCTTEKARTVTAKLIVTPSPDRRAVQIKTDITSKLAGQAAASSIFYLARRGGVLQVGESVDPNQLTIGESIDAPTQFPGGKR